MSCRDLARVKRFFIPKFLSEKLSKTEVVFGLLGFDGQPLVIVSPPFDIANLFAPSLPTEVTRLNHVNIVLYFFSTFLDLFWFWLYSTRNWCLNLLCCNKF